MGQKVGREELEGQADLNCPAGTEAQIEVQWNNQVVVAVAAKAAIEVDYGAAVGVVDNAPATYMAEGVE